MTKNLFENLLSRARLRISQKATHSSHSTQIVNVNLLLSQDAELRDLTRSLIDRSRGNEGAFRTITDFLRNVDVDNLDVLEQSLVLNWLRKVVAANHIAFAKQAFPNPGFQLAMLDTSLYDQPHGVWTENHDFLEVVDFDGRLARALRRQGNVCPVLRVFFVPDSDYLESKGDYVLQAVTSQVLTGIECAVGRADYLSLIDDRYICDLFLVKDELVCCIEKPFWQFQLQREPKIVREYYDMIQAILRSDYVIRVSEKNQHEAPNLLRELAVL